MFYYNIIFKNDSELGGHNCTAFETKGELLIIKGYDNVPYINGIESQYWENRYKLYEIKEFKIEIMEKENEKFKNWKPKF